MSNILLIGSNGRGNLGDDAFLVAGIETFKDHKIFINSANDGLLPAEARLHVETIHTHSFVDVIKKVKVFVKISTVIYWGGDVWVKYYGDKFPRRPLYKMLILNLILKVFGKKIFYIGCGIGNLTGFDLHLAKASARLADVIILRDERSKEILKLPNTPVLPDLTSLLMTKTNSVKSHEGKVNIGISILYNIHNKKVQFPKMIKKLAAQLNMLSPSEVSFSLIPLLINDTEKHDDLWASKQLLKHLSNFETKIISSKDIKDFTYNIQNLDMMIGSRLHACIFSVFNGVPTIGLSYRPKVLSFFRNNNIESYCINLKQLNNLVPMIIGIIENSENVRKKFRTISNSNYVKSKQLRKIIDEHIGYAKIT